MPIRILPILLKSVKIIVAVFFAFAMIYIVIQIVIKAYSLTWTGFGDFVAANGEIIRGKTLWDWMQLLLIPIFLSIGVFFLNRSERIGERESIVIHKQEAALQDYLDRMTDLLLKENLRKTKTMMCET